VASTNVVLILADDMGYSDLGCYGGEIRTPNLDRLGREGIRFAQFYNTARCSPSRASMLTGLHPHQTGIGILVNNDGPGGYPGSLNDRCVTVAEVLADAGYATGLSGKWHLTSSLREPTSSWPTRRGFQHFFGTTSGCGSYYQPSNLFRGEQDASDETLEAGFFYSDAIAADAAGFIRDSAAVGRPFFSYVAFTAPHWPVHAPEADIAAYDGVYDVGWDVLRKQRLARQQAEGLLGNESPLSDRDPTQPAWADAEDPRWEARRMAAYAAQVERMDHGVGVILDQLEASGVRENTLVIFLSDNGACAEILPLGDPEEFRARRDIIPAQTRDGHPLRVGNDPSIDPGAEDTYASYGQAWANLSNTPFRFYKRWVHEGGIATPLIMNWPAGALERGRIVRGAFQLTDILPTIVDITGTPYPAEFRGRPVLPLEGRSMIGDLRGAQPCAGDADLCWEHIGNCAIRSGDWKLVREYPRPWELYRITEDRSELHDVAAQHPDIVEKLSAAYEQWATRVGVVPRQQILDLYEKAARTGHPVPGGR
jgi:arylsulfatase A-like enzyme